MENIDISPIREDFDIECTYHSDRQCQNYDASISGILWGDGTISLRPVDKSSSTGFQFINSDPDRVIAIANLLKAFAEMAKERKG